MGRVVGVGRGHRARGLRRVVVRVGLEVAADVRLADRDLVGHRQPRLDLRLQHGDRRVRPGEPALHAVAVDVAGVVDRPEHLDRLAHLRLVELVRVLEVVVVELPVHAGRVGPLAGGLERLPHPGGLGVQARVRVAVQVGPAEDAAPLADLRVRAVADLAAVVVDGLVHDVPGHDDVRVLGVLVHHQVDVVVEPLEHRRRARPVRVGGVVDEAVAEEPVGLLAAVPGEHVPADDLLLVLRQMVGRVVGLDRVQDALGLVRAGRRLQDDLLVRRLDRVGLLPVGQRRVGVDRFTVATYCCRDRLLFTLVPIWLSSLSALGMAFER